MRYFPVDESIYREVARVDAPLPLSLVVLIDNLDIGGAQRLLESQIKAMAGSHCTIRVVNLSGPSSTSEKLRATGVEVVDIDQRRLIDWRGWQRLEKLLREWRPDILHAHLIHSALMGAAFAQAMGIRLVITLHNQMPDSGGLLATVKNGLERLVLSHATDRIVACGPRVAHFQQSRIGRTPMTVVANRIEPPLPLNAHERSQLRASLGYGPEDVVVVTAGRLTVQKGIDILVEAFAHVVREAPEAKLLIVGEGEDYDNLSRLVQCAQLSEAVQLAGPRSDVDRLLAAADVFCLPSRWEGLPMVLLEAMAAGLPVIATDVGDVATVIGSDAGTLVRPENAPDLRAAVVQIVKDAERRAAMSAAARRTVGPYVDMAGFACELLAVYRDVTSPGKVQ